VRKLIASLSITAAVLGGGVVLADPGPNGRNNYGLCTAYFNGSSNKHQAPPFQALEEAAGVTEDDTPEQAAEKVAEFCSTATPGGNGGTPGNPGYGQPKGNGRNS
jgi:hypothetical protein